MFPVMVSRAILLLLLLSHLGFAAYVRDLPLLNSTTTVLSVETSTRSTPTGKPFYKPHIEDSATGFGPESTLEPQLTTEPDTPATETESRALKPHLENSATVSGLEPDKPTRKNGYYSALTTTSALTVTTDPPDVGAILSSIFKPSSNFAHIESTATGLGPPENAASTTEEDWPTGPAFRQHVESSATDFADDGTVTRAPTDLKPNVTPPPTPAKPTHTYAGETLLPTSGTKIVIGGSTIGSGQTATIGDGPSPTLVNVGPNGEVSVVVGSSTSVLSVNPTGPVPIGDETATAISSGLVVGGQTLTQGGSPITIGPSSAPTTLSIDTSGHTVAVANGATSTLAAPATQTFNIGQTTGTIIADSNQFVLGSATLAVGQPITVGGTIISVTTDAAGSTVLIAGGSSTTLASPAEATDFSMSTVIVSGTTGYIVNSQTLFPGHPITVDGTAIAITTTSGSTILVVGSVTTTLAGGHATSVSVMAMTSAGSTLTQETSDFAGVATTSAATATPTSGADSSIQTRSLLFVIALSAIIAAIGLG